MEALRTVQTDQFAEHRFPGQLLSLGDHYVYGLIDPRSKQIFYIGKSTVGFRMPNIAVTQKIIKEVGVLVGPSANLSGSKSPSFFADLSPEILENAAVAVQDDSIYGLDTTIIDLTQEKPKLLRQGAVTKEELLKKVPELGQIE